MNEGKKPRHCMIFVFNPWEQYIYIFQGQRDLDIGFRLKWVVESSPVLIYNGNNWDISSPFSHFCYIQSYLHLEHLIQQQPWTSFGRFRYMILGHINRSVFITKYLVKCRSYRSRQIIDRLMFWKYWSYRIETLTFSIFSASCS